MRNPVKIVLKRGKVTKGTVVYEEADGQFLPVDRFYIRKFAFLDPDDPEAVPFFPERIEVTLAAVSPKTPTGSNVAPDGSRVTPI